MSKLSDELRSFFHIINNHDLLRRFGREGSDFCCDYLTGGGGDVRGTRVYCPTKKTDPDGPFYNHGSKKFVGKRSESMPKALEWAIARSGEKDWVPSPFGGMVPTYVVEAAKKACKEARCR